MPRQNNGKLQIERFAGNRHKSPLSSISLDELVARLRALTNIEIVAGNSAAGRAIVGDSKTTLVIPQANNAGLNFRGGWFADSLLGKSFVPGDLVWLDASSSQPSDGPNTQSINITAKAGATPVTFTAVTHYTDDGGGDFSVDVSNLTFSFDWIILCTAKVTPSLDISIGFPYPGGLFTYPIFSDVDAPFWRLFCITNPGVTYNL